MLTQLDPPIPVVTPKGKGLAHVLIDYGAEHDLIWIVFLDENGECWSYPNKDIRGQINVTMNRPAISWPVDDKRGRPMVVPNV
jgi:hypothetical protein